MPVAEEGRPLDEDELRRRLFGHIQSLSVDSMDRRRLGDVIARLTGDVQAIESFVLSGVADGLSAILRILFFSAALFYLLSSTLGISSLFLLVGHRAGAVVVGGRDTGLLAGSRQRDEQSRRRNRKT